MSHTFTIAPYQISDQFGTETVLKNRSLFPISKHHIKYQNCNIFTYIDILSPRYTAHDRIQYQPGIDISVEIGLEKERNHPRLIRNSKSSEGMLFATASSISN